MSFWAVLEVSRALAQQAVTDRIIVTSSREPLHAVALRYYLATVYAWNGDRAAALQLLEEIVKLPGGPEAGDLELNPRWGDLRGDPRFANHRGRG